MPRKPFPWRMGADPELSILLDGKKCNAKALFDQLKKPDGTVKTAMGFKTPTMQGDIGWDGCNATAELRPDASDSVDGLVENIRSIFQEVFPKLPAFDFSSLSFYAPIGGHVHLDLPDRASDETILRLRKQLVSFYLPIMLSENAVSSAIRMKNYGKIGDYHADRKFIVSGKEIRTFEFRSPSAEWLTTPKVATAVLAYLAVVWHECRNNPNNVAKYKDIAVKTEKQMEALQTIASSNFSTLTAMLMTQIRRAVRTFEFYPEYKKEIDWLLTPRNVIKEKSRVGYDIARGWGMRTENDVTKKDFLTKKSLAAASAKNGISLEFCTRNILIPYNDDLNVSLFASALSERVASYGWKPKNNYYFFGLKKGTEKIIAANADCRIAFDAHEVDSSTEKDRTIHALDRMISRARDRFTDSAGISIDPETGAIKKSVKPIIVVGLPSTMREKLNTKAALEAIWKIEKGETTFKEIAIVSPKAHAPKPAFSLAEAEGAESLQDRTSQGHEYAQDAIRQLTQENGGFSILPGSEPSPPRLVERPARPEGWFTISSPRATYN